MKHLISTMYPYVCILLCRLVSDVRDDGMENGNHTVTRRGGDSYYFLTRDSQTQLLFNTLTPVPPVTARDEPWPFFHFWRHHFWPKLASSILNFCRRKRSFQWCLDQSDWLNGAWDVHKNAQKDEWKTQSKLSCHLMARRASCHVANAFSTRLKLIWRRSSHKTTKNVQKMHF